MAKWHRKITKSELKHIRETTHSCTLEQFKRNVKWQRDRDAENDNPQGNQMTCMECHFIARKLGV